MNMTLSLEIAALLFFLYLGAYISACETALFSLSSFKLKTYGQSSDTRLQMIANLLKRPRDLLVTIFMINTLANIMLQNVTSSIFGVHASWLFKVLLPLLLCLLIGEVIPKYIGMQNNVSIAYRVAPFINFLQNILGPIRKFFIWVTDPISRIMFFYLKKEPPITKEQIAHLLETSETRGMLNRDEVEIISGYLKLLDSQVKELMRPKEDIIYYDIHEPLSKLIYLFSDMECSRMPVCENTFDQIVGIITVNNFFRFQSSIVSSKDLSICLEKPFYIPENTSARALLKKMGEKLIELALVVDEYGSITGLITKEDLIESVVGQIKDLRDIQPLYTKTGKNEIIASGKLELQELNAIFDLHLTSTNNMMTVGGWLTEQLGDIPKTGSKHEIEGVLFQVLASTPKRVTRLYIRKKKKP